MFKDNDNNYVILILEDLILKLENEISLYNQSRIMLDKQLNIVNRDYKLSIAIDEFLKKLLKLKDDEEIRIEYEQFLSSSINNDLTYRDVFLIKEIKEENGKKKILYTVNMEPFGKHYYRPNEGLAKVYKIKYAIKNIGEKAIVGAVQAFEEYLKSILRGIVIKYPKAYLNERSIKYENLIGKNFEELKEELIEEVVSDLMYDTIETIKKIDQKHKFHIIEKYQDLFEAVNEVSKHRNIIVHNNGEVNQIYLDSVANNSNNLKIGDYISCKSKLIEQKINTLLKFSFLLFYCKGTTEIEELILSVLAFEMLEKENWEVSQFVYELLKKTRNISHEDKVQYELNELNAKKHMFGLEKVKDEIENLDVSGMEKKYSIAKNLLLEDDSKVIKDLNDTYPNSFNAHQVESWPIFIEFRKTKEYSMFKNNHIKDFETYEYEQKD